MKIRNTRLTVKRVLAVLATYPHREEVRREYPEIEDEDIRLREAGIDTVHGGEMGLTTAEDPQIRRCQVFS